MRGQRRAEQGIESFADQHRMRERKRGPYYGGYLLHIGEKRGQPSDRLRQTRRAGRTEYLEIWRKTGYGKTCAGNFFQRRARLFFRGADQKADPENRRLGSGCDPFA